MVPIAFESPSDLATAGQNSPRSTRFFILTSNNTGFSIQDVSVRISIRL